MGAANDVILFDTAQQFRAPPNYVPALQCGKHDLDRIVGKYSFAKADELHCGLNGCNQPHQYGYIIRLLDGRETHCGQKCGFNSFDGVLWHEVEARFQREESAKLNRERIAEVLAARTELLSSAYDLRAAIKESVRRVSDIVSAFTHNRPLYDALMRCVRDGGKIQVAEKVDSDMRDVMGAGQTRANLRTIAELASPDVVDRHGHVLGAFNAGVVHFLEGLTDAAVQAMDEKALENASRKLSETRRGILEVHTFQRAVERFCSDTNLAKLWKLRLVMPRRQVTQRTERVLKKVTGVAAPDAQAA